MDFDGLARRLAGEERVYVQTHDYPDHDAVASAFALQYLLGELGARARLVYAGTIQRDSLLQMITELGIEIRPCGEVPMTERDPIVIVDGCKGSKNVTDLIGDEVGVIDHHEVGAPEDVPYVDIRPGYGACSSILYSYLAERGVEIPRRVATALMVGINMDTALLTRGVGKPDIEAYASLYGLSDISLQNSILRNYIQTKDLAFYRYVIENVRIADALAYCYLPDGCNQNLLGILGDFLLALEEVEFVVLCARNGGGLNFSVRSERKEWNASRVLQEALAGIGFGGGHADMAGGVARDGAALDPGEILRRFRAALAP